jgi:hypothetical protein
MSWLAAVRFCVPNEPVDLWTISIFAFRVTQSRYTTSNLASASDLVVGKNAVIETYSITSRFPPRLRVVDPLPLLQETCVKKGCRPSYALTVTVAA